MKLTKVLAQPIILGREDELVELNRVLQSAFQAEGSTVFVSGEAGSGKTRLINEFLSRARKEGVITLTGRCLSNAAVPYFPFFEAFSAFFSPQNEELNKHGDFVQTQPEVIGWLMGPEQLEQLGKTHPLTPQAWKDQTFASVINTITSISNKQPTILFLDDVQWADSASLTLLHWIARVVGSKKIVVLASFRSEELTSDAEGHPSPFLETLRQMGREDLYSEISLTNLGAGNISKLAENMLGGSISPELAEMLAKESAGNPLFIVESLRMLAERESIVQENNQWRLTVDTLSIPSKVKDIILRRLGWLKHNQRRVLDAASVIGEKFNVELLASVLSQDSLEVLDTLNLIAQSTSLVCAEETSYRFDHAKSREAIYDEIPLPLKKGYHSKVADKLEGTKQQGKQPLSDIAYHYAQAGNKEKAAKYSLAAGQDALSRWSNQEAIDHFKYALQNVPQTPETAEFRITAKECLGDALYAHCRFEDAFKVFEEIANSETGKLRLRAYRKAMDAIFRKGDTKRLFELVNKAEQYTGSDRVESARVLWSKARAEVFTGDMEASLKDHQEALRVFEEEYSLPDVAQLLCGTGSTLSFLACPDKALNLTLRSIALFREFKDAEGELNAAQIDATAFAFAGLLEESANKWLNVLQLSERLGHHSYMAFAHFSIGNRFENRGNFREAVSHSLKSIECSIRTDNKFYLFQTYASLCRQYARLGDLENAEEYLSKLKTSGLEYKSWLNFYVVSSESIVFAARAQWKEADRQFEKTFELLREIASPLAWEVRIRRHYAWALKTQGRTADEEAQLQKISNLLETVENKYGHVALQANLMAKRQVTVGKEFEIRLEIVNVSRKPGLILKAQDVIPKEFEVTNAPPQYLLENGSIDIQRNIGPFQVEAVKFTVKANKPGRFDLNPNVAYVDDIGETKTCKPNQVSVTVQLSAPVANVAPGRVSSGWSELDSLLRGGIPQRYALILNSPSSEERDLLVKRFIETHVEVGEKTFDVTTKAGSLLSLVELHPSNLFLFLCSPRADIVIPNLPNVFKLRGVENLTEIDIAIAKALRTIDSSARDPKVACIQIVSDVLLQHHALVTRKWLSALLLDLKSKGFTILALVDYQMHPPDEVQAILSLFEGEIRVTEKESVNGVEKILRIRKLEGEQYSESELLLTREKLLRRDL